VNKFILKNHIHLKFETIPYNKSIDFYLSWEWLLKKSFASLIDLVINLTGIFLNH
jgi:hypothetical protein